MALQRCSSSPSPHTSAFRKRFHARQSPRTPHPEGRGTMGAAPALTRMRHEIIRAELARAGGVRIRDLVNSLGVSRATVRRDLRALVDAGEAVNARGGALLPADRVHGVTALEHEAIARAAADKIAADEVKQLGLFGGPLVHDLARRLIDRTELHVVTNSLAVA